MAGPTTEILNSDIKEIREDLHRVEMSLRGEIGGLRVDVTSLASNFRLVMAIFSVVLTATLGVAITGLCTGFYWAGSVNAAVKNLEIRADERSRAIDARLEAVESRFKAIDTHFDRMETALTKILDQTRNLQPLPAPSPAAAPSVPRADPPTR